MNYNGTDNKLDAILCKVDDIVSRLSNHKIPLQIEEAFLATLEDANHQFFVLGVFGDERNAWKALENKGFSCSGHVRVTPYQLNAVVSTDAQLKISGHK